MASDEMEEMAQTISEMTFDEKVKALMKEGGYTLKEAVELLQEMRDS